MRNKDRELEKLEKEIAACRSQPIYSGEEAKKLREAEKLLSEAAKIAGEDRTADEPPLRLYEDEYVAELYGEDLGLTLTEFEMLSTLKRHSPKAYTRQQLLDIVFQDVIMVTERTVDAHINNLREKLGDHSDCIETVRGVGYKYTDEAFGET